MRYLRKDRNVEGYLEHHTMKNPERLTLEDYIDAPELFAAYPDLREMPIHLAPLPSGNGGNYTTQEDWLGETTSRHININQDLMSLARDSYSHSAREKIIDVILHETQHAIQDVENFARGGSPGKRIMLGGPTLEAARQELDLILNREDYKAWKEADALYREAIKARKAAENMEPRDYDLLIRLNDEERELNVKAHVLYSVEVRHLEHRALQLQDRIDNGMLLSFDDYQNLVGEREANDVVNRRHLSEEIRHQKMAASTENLPWEQQIVTFVPAFAASMSPADREIGGALTDHLQHLGIPVNCDLREHRQVLRAAEKDHSMVGRVRYMQTQDGKRYGFTYKGGLYLDPRKVDGELSLHEYAHLWCEALRRLNPKGWREVVDIMKHDTDSWVFIQKRYLSTVNEDNLAEETIAEFSGKRGAEKLRAELARMAERDDAYKSRWNNIYQNINKSIGDFWGKCGDSVLMHYSSPEEIYDQILKDFVSGVNPMKKVEKMIQQRDKDYLEAVKTGDMETATRLMNKSLEECVGNGVTPVIAVDGYRGRLDRLARKVKSGDPDAVDEAALMMAPLVKFGNAVLVPAPSHTGEAGAMLALANAISYYTYTPVADVLRSDPRESQYEAKRATGEPILAKDLGIRAIASLPEGSIPVIIDNVVDSGNTAEACVEALGGGVVLSLASAASHYGHVASLKSALPIETDRNGEIVPLSQRFDLGSKYVGRVTVASSQEQGEERGNHFPEPIIISDDEKREEIFSKMTVESGDNEHVGYSETLSDVREGDVEHLQKSVFYDGRVIGWAMADMAKGADNALRVVGDDAYQETWLLDVRVHSNDIATNRWEGIDGKELDAHYGWGCIAFDSEEDMLSFYEAHREDIDYRNMRYDRLDEVSRTAGREAAEELSKIIPVQYIFKPVPPMRPWVDLRDEDFLDILRKAGSTDLLWDGEESLQFYCLRNRITESDDQAVYYMYQKYSDYKENFKVLLKDGLTVDNAAAVGEFAASIMETKEDGFAVRRMVNYIDHKAYEKFYDAYTTAYDARIKAEEAAKAYTVTTVQGLEDYDVEDIELMVEDHVKEILAEEFFDEDIWIKEVTVIGSRARGEAHEGSDLDILLEYGGYGVSEDTLFNVLNEERMEIDGIEVDINPINARYTLDTKHWLERDAFWREHDREVREKIASNYKKSDNHMEIEQRLNEMLDGLLPRQGERYDYQHGFFADDGRADDAHELVVRTIKRTAQGYLAGSDEDGYLALHRFSQSEMEYMYKMIREEQLADLIGEGNTIQIDGVPLKVVNREIVSENAYTKVGSSDFLANIEADTMDYYIQTVRKMQSEAEQEVAKFANLYARVFPVASRLKATIDTASPLYDELDAMRNRNIPAEDGKAYDWQGWAYSHSVEDPYLNDGVKLNELTGGAYFEMLNMLANTDEEKAAMMLSRVADNRERYNRAYVQNLYETTLKYYEQNNPSESISEALVDLLGVDNGQQLVMWASTHEGLNAEEPLGNFRTAVAHLSVYEAQTMMSAIREANMEPDRRAVIEANTPTTEIGMRYAYLMGRYLTNLGSLGQADKELFRQLDAAVSTEDFRQWGRNVASYGEEAGEDAKLLGSLLASTDNKTLDEGIADTKHLGMLTDMRYDAMLRFVRDYGEKHPEEQVLLLLRTENGLMAFGESAVRVQELTGWPVTTNFYGHDYGASVMHISADGFEVLSEKDVNVRVMSSPIRTSGMFDAQMPTTEMVDALQTIDYNISFAKEKPVQVETDGSLNIGNFKAKALDFHPTGLDAIAEDGEKLVIRDIPKNYWHPEGTLVVADYINGHREVIEAALEEALPLDVDVDMEDNLTILDHWTEIKNQHPDELLVLRQKGFVEAFGQDAFRMSVMYGVPLYERVFDGESVKFAMMSSKDFMAIDDKAVNIHVAQSPVKDVRYRIMSSLRSVEGEAIRQQPDADKIISAEVNLFDGKEYGVKVQTADGRNFGPLTLSEEEQQEYRRLHENGSMKERGDFVSSVAERYFANDIKAHREQFWELFGDRITNEHGPLVISGDLDPSIYTGTSLPDDLEIMGSLDARHSSLEALPEGLIVHESLYIRGTEIKAMPSQAYIGGDMYLGDLQNVEIPEGVTVEGKVHSDTENEEEELGTEIENIRDIITKDGLDGSPLTPRLPVVVDMSEDWREDKIVIAHARVTEDDIIVYENRIEAYDDRNGISLSELPADKQKEVLDVIKEQYDDEERQVSVLLDTQMVPSYALPAIINGDFSGIDDPEDEKNIRDFIGRDYYKGANFSFRKEDPSFTNNPAFGQPTDCVTVDIIRFATVKELREDYRNRVTRPLMDVVEAALSLPGSSLRIGPVPVFIDGKEGEVYNIENETVSGKTQFFIDVTFYDVSIKESERRLSLDVLHEESFRNIVIGIREAQIAQLIGSGQEMIFPKPVMIRENGEFVDYVRSVSVSGDGYVDEINGYTIAANGERDEYEFGEHLNVEGLNVLLAAVREQKNKVVLHKIEGINTHPMEKIVVTMLNLPEQRITVDLYGYDGSVHGLDVTGGVIQGGVLTFADGSTTDLDYMIGTTLESQLGKTLADQIESMDMSDTVEHPIVDKGAAIWDYYADGLGFSLIDELSERVSVIIPNSGDRMKLPTPLDVTILGNNLHLVADELVRLSTNNAGFSTLAVHTTDGQEYDLDMITLSDVVALHKSVDNYGKYYAFGQEVPQETIDELRADGVTDFSTENLEKLLHFDAQDNGVPTIDVDFREGASERVWQKLNEILPENGDKIVLNEPFTITQAEGYPVGRAQEIKEIVRAASPEYDTDVFVCGDELGGINTFRMVYGDLARVENILDKVNYTVELQQNPEMDAELREAKGYLMDVIDHARNEIGDVILIPQTDIHLAGVKIPVSGLYYVQDGKGEGEYRLMDKDGSALAVQSGKFSEFSVDKIIEDYHSAYVLTQAVREAQIANLVGKGDEISFADGIMVSRDEPVTLKDVVNMVKFENNGELKVIGYRLDDEENRVDLDEIGGLELSGLDDLYVSVKEIREAEKLEEGLQESESANVDANEVKHLEPLTEEQWKKMAEIGYPYTPGNGKANENAPIPDMIYWRLAADMISFDDAVRFFNTTGYTVGEDAEHSREILQTLNKEYGKLAANMKPYPSHMDEEMRKLYNDSIKRRAALEAVGYPYPESGRKPDGSFDIPTLDESLYWDYAAGLITLREAAGEFNKANWTPFIDEKFTLKTFESINEKYGKLSAEQLSGQAEVKPSPEKSEKATVAYSIKLNEDGVAPEGYKIEFAKDFLTHVDAYEISAAAGKAGAIASDNAEQMFLFKDYATAEKFGESMIALNEKRAAEEQQPLENRRYTEEEANQVKSSMGEYLQNIVNERFSNGDIYSTEIADAMKEYMVFGSLTAQDAAFDLTTRFLNKSDLNHPGILAKYGVTDVEAEAEKIALRAVRDAESKLPKEQKQDALSEQRQKMKQILDETRAMLGDKFTITYVQPQLAFAPIDDISYVDGRYEGGQFKDLVNDLPNGQLIDCVSRALREQQIIHVSGLMEGESLVFDNPIRFKESQYLDNVVIKEMRVEEGELALSGFFVRDDGPVDDFILYDMGQKGVDTFYASVQEYMKQVQEKNQKANEERAYEIQIGTWPGMPPIYGEYHLQFIKDVSLVKYEEMQQIAADLGGEMRVTSGSEWADFARREDAEKFADTVLALHAERQEVVKAERLGLQQGGENMEEDDANVLNVETSLNAFERLFLKVAVKSENPPLGADKIKQELHDAMQVAMDAKALTIRERDLIVQYARIEGWDLQDLSDELNMDKDYLRAALLNPQSINVSADEHKEEVNAQQFPNVNDLRGAMEEVFAEVQKNLGVDFPTANSIWGAAFHNWDDVSRVTNSFAETVLRESGNADEAWINQANTEYVSPKGEELGAEILESVKARVYSNAEKQKTGVAASEEMTSKMAPIYAIHSQNPDIPVRYGVHAYTWRSGDEDYDTAMHDFYKLYNDLHRKDNNYVYGYKIGFIFNDQKDALELHKAMVDYVKGIGREDVLARVEHSNKIAHIAVEGLDVNDAQFALNQQALAEGRYLEGVEQKVSEQFDLRDMSPIYEVHLTVGEQKKLMEPFLMRNTELSSSILKMPISSIRNWRSMSMKTTSECSLMLPSPTASRMSLPNLPSLVI